MHTGHFILVKADSHEEAEHKVWNALNDETTFASHWSDWAIVGDEGFSESRFEFPYFWEQVHGDEDAEWTGASRYSVSLQDEADLFHKMVSHFKELREKAFDSAVAELDDYSLSDFKLDDNSQKTYALWKFAQLVYGIYTWHSAYYDLENYNVTLSSYEESVAQGETDWYGVLVDFHF